MAPSAASRVEWSSPLSSPRFLCATPISNPTGVPEVHVLVTGGAGFIGSHLCEALLDGGHDVLAVDALTDYYDPAVKQANVAELRSRPKFELLEVDLVTADVDRILDGMEVVFHLAGQPGVRNSWAAGFREYVDANVVVTQRLLEAARVHAGLLRFVNVSSSSIYGEDPNYPTVETQVPCPHSPYGVTKLAAEHLGGAYAANWGVPTVILRYFTVYGPRQRPDMAIHRFVNAALKGEEVALFGDGEQRRDFTYVTDVVAATIAAAFRDLEPGTVVNVAGGSDCTVNELIDLIAAEVGTPLAVRREPAQAGDVSRTLADTTRARELLAWTPALSLSEGVSHQVRWHRERGRM